jgi:hypothetical protein
MTTEGPRGPALYRKYVYFFQKRNRSFISVTEFTYINKHEKNNIKKP